MQAVSGLNSSLAAGVLACGSLLCAAPLRASVSGPGALSPVAHSALVTLEAGPAPGAAGRGAAAIRSSAPLPI